MRNRNAYLRVALAMFVLIASLTSSGCEEKIDAVQAEVVRNYAQALPEVLAAVSLDGIRPYATPNQVDRVRLYVIMQTEERGLRLQARLVDQEVLSTEMTGENTAEVVTSETWSIVYYDRQTGAETSRDDYTAQTTYELYRGEGTWRVDSVEPE